MHEMQTIVTNECGVCLSVCPSIRELDAAQLGSQRMQGSFGAAFAKQLWPLIRLANDVLLENQNATQQRTENTAQNLVKTKTRNTHHEILSSDVVSGRGSLP